mmetsp:Transcript_25203/g.51448  ORF Transcript_25203/g.51448 Transcript_25203/m.51448 type:complete len:431 (-) Transcript_25203:1908-3200(-)
MSDPLLSMMDTAYIGRLGANSLAALGVCTSIFYMSFYGFLATKTATTTLVASASSDKEAALVTSTSLQLGVAAGFLVMFGLRLFGRQCLSAMGVASSSEIFPYALTYLNTRCLSAPFFLLITVAEGALRGYGDTKIPLLASTATAAAMVALEPLLMFVLGWQIKGAAAAMGLSQVAGASVYAYFLRQRFAQMKNDKKKEEKEGEANQAQITRSKILLDIAKANFSMIIKQGSLLFTWAYATKSATRLGAAHVAAHQVALSFWMVFAYVLDAVSVGAQVLLSKARKSVPEMRSVSKYMISVAVAQGLAITLIIAGLGPHVPSFFTQDESVIAQLKTLMPVLSLQQVLISLTFVMEALAAGGSQFSLLGIGTALSALAAVLLMRRANSVLEIWTGGVLAMFVGRLIAATFGVLNVNALLPKWGGNKKTEKNE